MRIRRSENLLPWQFNPCNPLRRTEPLPIPRLFSNALMKTFRIHPAEFPLDAFYKDRSGTDA
jgi:hypothetical protein